MTKLRRFRQVNVKTLLTFLFLIAIVIFIFNSKYLKSDGTDSEISNGDRDIVNISRAEYLDSSRQIISDVSNEVIKLDNISFEVPSGNYLRVTFSQNLTNSRDITIYASSEDPNASIQVYEKNRNQLLATFDKVGLFGKYQILLTNLSNDPSYSQDTFDLKSVGDIEYDYIFDPPQISFVSPTPVNGAVTSNTSILVNVSITEPSLGQFKWNWNGTNYTIYDNSLVLMYNFNNVSALGENNTYVVDTSGKGNNATVVGGNFTTSSGKYGGAMQFNSSNQYVNVGDISKSLNLSSTNPTPFTIAAWFYPKTPVYDGAGIHLMFNNNVKLSYRTSGSFDFRLNWSEGTYIISPDTFQNQWVYVVGTFNGTAIKLYTNGILEGTETPSYTGLSTDTMYMRVGYQFNGMIDEVRIYNRSLSQDEILELYYSNLNKYDTNSWDFLINQSKNSVNGLDLGNYTYRAYAADILGSFNSTEERNITIADLIPPQWYDNTTSSVEAGALTTFSVRWTDYNLSSYIFSFDNGTGTFVNDTSVAFTGTQNFSNATKIVNSTVGSTIRWRVYANDTFGNMNATNIFSYVTTTPDTTPPQISFVSPTPANGAQVENTSVLINVSISESSSYYSAWIDWNRSLVGYWSMDYSNSTGVYDNSSYGNFGKFNGGLSESNKTFGARGKALSFDGVNDYLDVGNSSSLAMTDQITVAAWVNPNEVTTKDEYIVYKPGSYLLDGMRGFGTVPHFYIYNSTGSVSVTSSIPLVANQWNYVVGTYNGTAISIYINGYKTPYSAPFSSKINVTINDTVMGLSPNCWNGSLDEVMIFNRALSPQEINASYNAGLYMLYKNFTNLSLFQSYNYSVYAIDADGNLNITNTRNVTINDLTAPQWSQNYTNTTFSGVSTNFSINWTDNFGLSGYIFSFDNGTGTFANDTSVAFSGTNNYSNVVKVTNSTIGSTIRWRVYANDTSGNMNATNIFSYVTTIPDFVYPQFSNYWDDNATLNLSGTGHFNVTVLNTNGTVLLEINNQNVTATNISGNVYNITYTFSNGGVYSYRWYSWGNGANHNINISSTRNYVVNSSGNVYYVANSGCSDSNLGTSPSQPWCHAPGMVGWTGSTTIAPGDSVLFNRGDKWVFSSQVNGTSYAIPTSGTAANRIFYGAYGTGNRPVFNASGLQEWNGMIGLIGISYVTIDNWELTGSQNQVMEMYGPGSVGVTVQNCVFHDNTAAGFQLVEINGMTTGGVTQITFNNNLFYNGPHDGLKFNDGVTYATVSNNVFHSIDHDGIDSLSMKTPAYPCYNFEIYNNDIYDITGGGFGMYIPGLVNSEIYDNKIHDFVGGGIQSDSQVFAAQNLTIRNNVFWNLSGSGYSAFWFNSGNTGIKIWSNTVYSSIKPDIALDGGESFANNLAYACTTDSSSVIKNFASNPLFVNPTGNPPDFHLQAGSPAIDAGTPIGLSYYGSAPDLGAYEFGMENVTTIPVLTLISPSNNSGWNLGSTVTFIYNVTDVGGISNCSLILNGAIDQTDSSITKGVSQSFSKSLANGNYNWSVNCTDSAGDMGNGSIYLLTVSYTASSGNTVSAGGGGGSFSTITAHPVNNTVTGNTTKAGLITNISITRLIPVINPDYGVIIGNLSNMTVKELNIQVNNQSNNVLLRITEHYVKPLTINATNLSSVYSYFQLDSENLTENLKNITMKLQIGKDWFSENGLEKENASLFHLNTNSNTWEEVGATYLNEDDNYRYYEATVNSSGYFYIGGSLAESLEENNAKTNFWLENSMNWIKNSLITAWTTTSNFLKGILEKIISFESRVKLTSGVMITLLVLTIITLAIIRARLIKKEHLWKV